MNTINFEEFVHAYMGAALWSSTDDEENPLDDEHDESDIADETQASMREDCADFIAANADDLAAYCEHMGNLEWSASAQAGHDFWLTRNGHGAGFWDRGLDELGQRLSDAAEVYGGVDLYIGDDGKAYA